MPKTLDQKCHELAVQYKMQFLLAKKKSKVNLGGYGGNNQISLKHHFTAGWNACLKELKERSKCRSKP